MHKHHRAPVTETPVQFTDGIGVPRGPNDGLVIPIAPITCQRWFSDDPLLTMEKFRKKVRSS